MACDWSTRKGSHDDCLCANVAKTSNPNSTCLVLTRRQESFWYHVSDKLGIEITLMGVGDWKHLPGQHGTQVSFGTEDGELAPWMVRAIDNKREMPWWFHTHPNMPAFLSGGVDEYNDVRGAHALWDMIRRPFMAIVAGCKKQRAEVLINKRWIRRHPEPPPPPKPVIQPYQPYGPNHAMAPIGLVYSNSQLPPYAVMPGLDNEVTYLVQKYGARSVYEALDRQVFMAYSDRRYGPA